MRRRAYSPTCCICPRSGGRTEQAGMRPWPRSRASAWLRWPSSRRAVFPTANSSGSKWRAHLQASPSCILLDEPAAGCNAIETAEIAAIIRRLARDGITVVLVEHDMRLVMNVSDCIHVLANGRTLAEGTAAQVRANPAVIETYLGVRGARETKRARRLRTSRAATAASRRCTASRSTLRPARS